MSVAVVAANSTKGGAVNSLQFALDCTGANLIFVGANCSDSTPGTVNTVAYASAGLSNKWTFLAQTYYRNTAWFKTSPATGSNNVDVTYSATQGELMAGAICFSGVDTGTPLGTEATNNGGATTPTVDVTSATGEMVVDNLYTGENVEPTATSPQVRQWFQYGVGGYCCAGGSTKDGAASVTMSWTVTGVSAWTLAGVSIKPSAAVSAAISGTATGTINENDVRAGGKTIIIELTGDTWRPA